MRSLPIGKRVHCHRTSVKGVEFSGYFSKVCPNPQASRIPTSLLCIVILFCNLVCLRLFLRTYSIATYLNCHLYLKYDKSGIPKIYRRSSAMHNAVGSMSMTSIKLEINNNVSSVSYKFGTRTK